MIRAGPSPRHTGASEYESKANDRGAHHWLKFRGEVTCSMKGGESVSRPVFVPIAPHLFE